jgi:hypothetical protein
MVSHHMGHLVVLLDFLIILHLKINLRCCAYGSNTTTTIFFFGFGINSDTIAPIFSLVLETFVEVCLLFF